MGLGARMASALVGPGAKGERDNGCCHECDDCSELGAGDDLIYVNHGFCKYHSMIVAAAALSIQRNRLYVKFPSVLERGSSKRSAEAKPVIIDEMTFSAALRIQILYIVD
jgi:hypothetical protein